MAAPNTSTCEPWATVADVGAPCNTYETDMAALEDALVIASDVLYNLTGRQWPGECETTVRPCGYRRPDSCGCLHSRTCNCARPRDLTLPGPVVSVEAVKIDGVTLDPARYRVDDHKHLVYLPESDSAERQGWPCCQRLDLPDTEDDTWSVTYVFGGAPPPGGTSAAASLGCQLALAATGNSACKLPKRVTSLVRQGTTVAVLDPLTLFKDGMTGLADVDLWVTSVMLGAKRRRASVWRPDLSTKVLRRPGT